MILQELIKQYIDYRRALGTKFRGNGFYLRSFCKMIGSDTSVESVGSVAVSHFIYGESQRITTGWFRRYNALKGLFQYAKARGYVQKIPLQKELPKHTTDFTPYIFIPNRKFVCFWKLLFIVKDLKVLQVELLFV